MLVSEYFRTGMRYSKKIIRKEKYDYRRKIKEISGLAV